MGENTKIEWTATHHPDGSITPGFTFNPWIGCAKVSAGCLHCYAETLMDTRYGRVEWGVNGTRVRTSPANWRKPLTWNRAAEEAGVRARVFCASLADVFEDRMELVDWRWDLFNLIAETPHLDWLLLTKRPENVLRLMEIAAPIELNAYCSLRRAFEDGHLRNVWIGTSVEDQAAADDRIPYLLRIPAAVRFLSMEPLLGPVDLGRNIGGTRWIGGQRGCDGTHRGIGTPDCPREPHHHHDDLCGRGIDWIIVGGESGPKARPMHPQWARDIRGQCVDAGVPFLFKQWGEYAPGGMTRVDRNGDEVLEFPRCMERYGKHAAGRRLDGRTWDEFPMPAQAGD